MVKVVWPAFLATSLEQPVDEEEGALDLGHHGIVLTRADVQGAANEETPRRAMRKATRDSDAAAQRRRRDPAVFFYPTEHPMDWALRSSSLLAGKQDSCQQPTALSTS
ncbi:hypothetical protein ColTof4_14094 [Colletotrichum tofieldiae]|uniref:Uncharacterized protein n=1 Tax=Colletotrichum tofieldiae TaxID=708197 RepID=A0A166WIQ2_9PEZI|nr:hypothetical protein CT0861_05368 [Colletotrichum tofieldiae]GKT55651.1 hypothetical protein ColTof3_02990 [Colletotrichum tofieldiae]GKT81671.1 hypothetical protein ColTof4_14094 [Colletotrichum tofieldiae]GKT82688.1 hypothetical protein Ct61P_00538 [Colletotrichum tofieldiae]